MNYDEANRLAHLPYAKRLLRCAINGRRPNHGGLADEDTTGLKALRKLGFIQCARAFAERHGHPIPMGGWVATDDGVAFLDGETDEPSAKPEPEQLTLEGVEPETYNVREDRVADLESKVKRYAKRARKLGLTPFELVKGDTVRVPVHKDNDESKPIIGYRLVVPCQLIGSAPVLNGWRFVARIEHLGEAGNIIACAPGQDDIVPADMRDGSPTCDHCQTRRARKETFVCQHEDGSLVRVGRSCLKDFCGTKDAAAAVAIWSLMTLCKSYDDEDGHDVDGYGAIYPDTEHFVACAFRSVSLHGWQSKGTYYHGGPRPTAQLTDFAASPCTSRNSEIRAAWDEAQPLDGDKKKATEAIAWAKDLTGSSDYEHNLKVAASLPYVADRHTGILASIVVAYSRHCEQEVERARKVKLGEGSEHFGKVGSRYVALLTLRRCRAVQGTFGVTFLCVFEDSEGNILKWWASDAPVSADGKEIAIDDEVLLTFAVKNHGTHNNANETVITRAKAVDSLDGFKWLGHDGEIFKTKKAMLAA